MAGFDARDSTCVDRPKDDYVGGLAKGVKGLRIGMPREYFSQDLARDVADPIHAAIEEYKKLGATVVEVSLPNQTLVGAGVLRARARRGVVEPLALRRRALRPSRARVHATSSTCTARRARRASAPR